MNVLSEYENDPKLHIQKLKMKQRQINTFTRLFSESPDLTETLEMAEKRIAILEKIKAKLQEYKDEYPEYFI
jgi:hypothetical protein